VWDAVDKAGDNSEDILSRHEAISALLGLFTDQYEFQASEVFNLIQDTSPDEKRQRLRDAFLAMRSKTVKSAASTGHALKKLIGFIADEGTLIKRTVNNISKYSVDKSKK